MRGAYFILVFLFFITFSCSDSKYKVLTDDAGVVSVVISDIPETVLDASNFVDSLRHIQLEHKQDAIIQGIAQVIFTDSMLIVSESRTKAVLYFDLTGKYLRRINKRGRGPGEYLNITKVLVDEDLRNVLIYDGTSRRLLFYDYAGNYIRSISDFSNGYVIRDMINLPDGGFLCYCPDKMHETPGGLWYVNSKGEMADYLYVLDTTYPLYSSQFPFSLFNLSGGRIGFAETVFSDIYCYDGEGLHKKISYRFPGINLSDLKGTTTSSLEGAGIMVMHAESDYFVITEFISNQREYGMVILSKQEGSFEVCKGLYGLFDERPILYGQSIWNNLPGVLVSIVDPGLLFRLAHAEQASVDMKHYITSIIGEVPEEDAIDMNPIVQLLFIKNN